MDERDAVGQVNELRGQVVQMLNKLVDVVREFRKRAVAAARCANAIAELRGDLERIEARFREIERGSGEDARVQ